MKGVAAGILVSVVFSTPLLAQEQDRVVKIAKRTEEPPSETAMKSPGRI